MGTLHPPEPRDDHEALMEVYWAVQGLRADQARDAQDLKDSLDTICLRCKAEDRRLSRVELWQRWLTGALGVSVVAVLGAAGWFNVQIGWIRDLVVSHISSTGGRMP